LTSDLPIWEKNFGAHEAGQHADDDHHHQQFEQGEAASTDL
jgi:hypothetical protein